jgi:hypothetical protein
LIYAIVINGVVADFVSPPEGVALDQLAFLTPEQVAAAVEVPNNLIVAQGWTYSGGTFHSSFTPPALTIPQQAQVLLTGGLAITSTGDSALNATYPCDPISQQQVVAEVTSILLNNAFTDGETSIAWLDKTGAPHTFSINQFKTLATALAAFVTGCTKCITGQSTTLPTATATIP